VEGNKEFLHCVRDGLAGFDWDAVEFATIAGRENDGFLEDALAAKLVCGMERLIGRESDALAEFDRRGAMIAADERDVNARSGGTIRIGGSSHQKNLWNLVR
jgi:hypothetical protein